MGKRRGGGNWVLFVLLVSCLFYKPSLSATISSSDAAAMQAFAKAVTPKPSGWGAGAGADPCSKEPRWEGVSCESGRVTVINLRSQSLVGSLPPEIGKLSALRSLSLQHNQLAGDLPSLENMASLQEIYLNDNNFSSIPETFFSGLTGLMNVSLDHNPLKDWSIPADLSGSGNLGWFSAMNAGVSGGIPEFFGKMVSLQMLRLSYNNLVGGIPGSFAGSGIKELDINNQNTKLSGRLDVLGSMTQLTTLMLQSNNFSGPIPDLSKCTLLTVLNLRDNRLTGVVPPSLGSLPSLANLSLANNLLQGPLPDVKAGIWKDSQSSGNKFCKPTPGPCDPRVTQLIDVAKGFEYPGLLATSWKGNNPCNKWLFVGCDPRGNITVLNFRNQGFGGTISPSIGEIKSLKTLILANNKLGGSIPDSLTTLPGLNLLDVSGNNLTGKIPKMGKFVLFNHTGNPLLGKDVSGGENGSAGTGSDASPTTTGRGIRSKSPPAGMIVLMVAVIVILVIAGTLAFFVNRRRKRSLKHKKHRPVASNASTQVLDLQSNYSGTLTTSEFHFQGNSKSSGVGAGSHVIEVESMYVSIDHLRRATHNFSEANILGRGGFGVVYRGQQLDGTLIAVKRMECGEIGKKGMGEFEAEIAVLTKVRHRHLVALLGYCMEGNERLLVYEYMPQGTLGQHLFDANEPGKRSFLNWKQRLAIALDVARGLEYLHSLAQKSFIHRDLKPSNILLDDDLRAKVSDFGLVKLAPDGKYSVETRLAGTFGYLAPEYATTGRVTTKVDVYAFGVVLMELITGRKALDESLSEQYAHLVSWYRRVLISKENIKKSVDPKLDLEVEDLHTLYALAELAGHCTAREANQRPDMGHAVNVLAPLVDQWKPTSSNHDYSGSFNMSFDQSLPQRLRRWQDNDEVSLELEAGMENFHTTGVSTPSSDTIPCTR